MARLDDNQRAISAAEPREVQLVTFEVGAGVYGIDILVVKEIKPHVTLTAVPRSSESVRGLVNIRGQVVLVLDLAVMLGREPTPRGPSDPAQVVILKTTSELRNIRTWRADFDPAPFGDKPLALLVDQLGDVLSFSRERVVSAPGHISATSSRHIEGVVEHDDHLLVILDPSTLLTSCTATATDAAD